MASSRKKEARVIIEEGLQEAMLEILPAGWGTTLILFLSLALREKAKALYSAEVYYASLSETTLAPYWEGYIHWAEDEIRR